MLLTGARAPVTLELARTFARAGIEVFVADSQTNLAEASGAVRAAFRVPEPRLYPRAFARALQRIALEQRVNQVIPTCEEIFWLAAALEEPEFAPLKALSFSPPLATLQRLHHKHWFVECMRELGLRVPLTKLLTSQMQLERLARGAALVLKPAYSRFAVRALILEPGQPVPSLPRITREQPWLAQDFVSGEELCAFGVARAGRVTAFVVYRPGWRAGLGASTSFSRLPDDDARHDQALEMLGRIVAGLNFTGQIALDLISNADGLTAIECNPRATSGAHLFAPSDRLERAYLEDLNAPILATGGAAKLGLPMALYALPGVLQATRRQAWLEAWRSSRDVLRDPSDPVPVMHQVRCALTNLATAWRLRCTPLEATTADIEWNGEALEPEIIGPCSLEPEEWLSRDWASRFLPVMRQHPTEHWVENLHCQLGVAELGEHLLAITLTHAGTDSSYVASPFTHYINYALDELRELRNPALERWLRVALSGLAAVLRFGRVDEIVFVDNTPVSTNLHPSFTHAELERLTAALVRAHPSLAIGMRSVHARDSRLVEYLRALGYRLVPARSVIFVPTRDSDVLRKRDQRRDAALLAGSGYSLRSLETATQAESERLSELYKLLYINKYSQFNPRYTPAFMAMAIQTGMLEFRVLEQDGRIDGVLGFYQRAGYLTAPVVGYDTELPQVTGLYRMLASALTQIAHERGLDLHNSSGVAAFKRSRGGEAELEYTAVYTKHLGWTQNLAWAVLEMALQNLAVPLLKKRGL